MEARFSAPVPTGPGAHPASCTMASGSFPGVKSGRGVLLTPHSLLVERVELYLYSPYGPYGLYRASVPVQGGTLPFFLHHISQQIFCFAPSLSNCTFMWLQRTSLFSKEACQSFPFPLLGSIYIYYINGYVFLAFLSVMYTITNMK